MRDGSFYWARKGVTVDPTAANSGGSDLASGASPPESAPAESSSPRSEGPSSWFKGVIETLRGPAREGLQDEAGAEDAAEAPDAGEPYRVYRTEADHREAIQAEVDRRENVRAQREAADKQRERQAEIARLHVEKEEARAEGDRWTADERQEQIDLLEKGIAQDADQGRALASFVAEIRDQDDRVMLDPLFAALPTEAAMEVLNAVSAKGPDGKPLIDPRDGLPVGIVGIEGRAAAVKAVLAAIHKQEFERAREALSRDGVFRKDVLRDYKVSDENEEPELIPAAQGAAPPRNMNAFLRSARRGPNQPSVVQTTT